MWLLGVERDSSGDRPGDEGAAAGVGPETMNLRRYRAYGRFYERYWAKLFAVTQADMARFAHQIQSADAAPTLTELAQDVIRARLRQGPQLQSGPAASDPGKATAVAARGAPEVRRWDPTGVWQPGDRAIVAVPVYARGRTYGPQLGEIIAVHDDRVVVHLDGSRAPQVLALGAGAYGERDVAAEAELAALGELADEAAQVDFVLWEHGRQVVSRLLQALIDDGRFVELEGRWSLRDLTSMPRESEVERLAMKVFDAEAAPLTMSEVLAYMPGVDARSFSRRLGVALALSERPDLFRNVGTGTYPRWELAGPPPATWTAHHAVYDPETYLILCAPGETLSPSVAQRLWELGLLRPAVERPAEPVIGDAGARGGVPDTRSAGPKRAGRSRTPGASADRRADADGSGTRGRPKWLPFGRQ